MFHKTIYCAIYARLPRARGTDRKGGLPNMTNIALRPPDILEGFERRLKSIPESLRKTMTYD